MKKGQHTIRNSSVVQFLRKEVLIMGAELDALSRGVLTIGVTGTKGKTSTAHLAAKMISRAGMKAALMTGESAVIAERHLAPCRTLRDLLRFFSDCHQTNIDCVVLELTSLSLATGLHRFLNLNCAVITNIGSDHIHLHGNGRNYVRAKCRILEAMAQQPSGRSPWGVINTDDRTLREAVFGMTMRPRLAAYGFAELEPEWPAALAIRIDEYAARDNGSSFTVAGLSEGVERVDTALFGRFNAYNLVAARICARLVADDPPTYGDRADFAAPPGRFQVLSAYRDGLPRIVIDYAHTPESLEAALCAARDLSRSGRIIVVFGCGGNSYKKKRPMMGAVAAKLAHSIVLTTDNTRGEDPVEIAMQIKRGIPRPLRRSVAWELDRRMAVRLALQQASPHDVVLICGRGAETEQEVGGRILARSDMEIVQEAIKTG